MTADTATAPVRDEAAEAADLRQRQTLVARERRLQKKAFRDPAIEDLLADHNTTNAALSELRAKFGDLKTSHDSLKNSHDELGSEASRLQVDNISLRGKLDSADAARGELLKAAEAADAELARLRTELSDTKEKLTSALKPKKG